MNAFKYAHDKHVLRAPTKETRERNHTRQLLSEANEATRRSGYGAIRDDAARIVKTPRPADAKDVLPANM